MKIYNYHPEKFYFVGESIADEDPLDKGNWLIPAHATVLPPLANAEGKIVVFVDGQWSYIDEPVDEPVEQTYAQKRHAEYPSIRDQLDALFHAGVFPAEMAAKIQAVKDKYPKV